MLVFLSFSHVWKHPEPGFIEITALKAHSNEALRRVRSKPPALDRDIRGTCCPNFKCCFQTFYIIHETIGISIPEPTVSKFS